MSIISDGTASKLRKLWLFDNRIISISLYPEKEKVFEQVTQALTIVIYIKSGITNSFNIILNTSGETRINNLKRNDIEIIDNEQCPFMFLGREELKLLKKIHSNKTTFAKIIRGYEGECHQTFHKSFYKNKNTGNLLVRGIHINKWYIDLTDNNKTQRWLDKEKFLESKKNSKTAKHYLRKRIIQQVIANIGQEVRLKATLLESGIFCGNSINYFLVNEKYKSVINNKFVLSLLNSKLMNWRFKLTSSNNNINCYEIHKLPLVNLKLWLKKQQSLVLLVDKIFTITKNGDYLQNKNKQKKIEKYEHQIDKLVYRLYDLEPEEIEIIENFNKR